MRFAHLLPAAAAVWLLLLELDPVRDAILNADPTLQGSLWIVSLRPLLSLSGHCAAITLGLYEAFASAPATRGARAGVTLCYGALAAELLALVPCVVFADALCGLYYVLVNRVAAPAMLIGLVLAACTAGSRALVRASLVVAAALLAAGSGLFWALTPKSALECDDLGEPLKRDTCVMNFALRNDDEKLCEQVDFDSSRWSCLYQIAERKEMPALCEKIALPCRDTSPGITCEPDAYRDTCYLVVARKIRDRALCGNVTHADLRASCESQASRK